MPVKIQRVTQTNWLRKTFGILGGFTPKLDETIVPVAITDDATKDAASTDVPCMGSMLRGAVVAEYSYVSLYNPADSGLLCFVDEIWLDLSIAGSVEFRSGAFGGATVNPHYRDARLWTAAGVPQVPLTRITHQTNVAVLGTQRGGPFIVPAATGTVVSPGFVLGGGDDFTVRGMTANVQLRVCFLYRQRSLAT